MSDHNSSTTSPDVPSMPRVAATILLLRDGVDGLEVFLVKRHEKSSAFAGALVFPGGVLDPQDRTGVADGDTDLPVRHAAIRELFEETGFTMAHDSDGAPLDPSHAARLVTRSRSAIVEGSLDFRAMLAQEQLKPSTAGLVLVARWVTPPIRRKRFDTHFFAAAAMEGQFGTHDGTELTDSIWMTPQAAISAGDSGLYNVLFPTRSQLLLLASYKTTAETLAAFALRKIIPIHPTTSQTEHGLKVSIPVEAGYPVSEFIYTGVLEPD